MTMEARLLQSLHDKLGHLERRTQAFHQEMVAEFQRYYQELLSDVTPTVASNIKQDVALSLTNYPVLGPELDAAGADSHLVDEPRPGATFQSHTPSAVFGGDEAPGSQHDSRHEREKELHGLFTPSYLPLIDSSPILSNSTPVVPVARPPNVALPGALPPTHLPAEANTQDPGANQCTAMGEKSESNGSPGNGPSRSPPPRRQQVSLDTIEDDTETPTSPASSSDSKAPRSALRHSSTLPKPPQSPRRVRFEFMGAEVLPTSSPQPSEFIAPRPTSPALDEDPVTSDSILGGDAEEDQPLPPRKISSSDALRALSRTPLEEGIWTVVNADRDQATQEEGFVTSQMSAVSTSSSSLRTATAATEAVFKQPPPVDAGQDDENSSEGEDFLALAKPKSSANKIAIRSPTLPSLENSTHDPSVNLQSTGYETGETSKDEENGDDMFHFESGDANSPPQPQRHPSPPADDQDTDDESTEPHTERIGNSTSIYATSPAVPIVRLSVPEPTTPARSKFQPGSLGSYKGRPLVMPVVRDPNVHARAISLGDFSSFVGSVDGSTGMDAPDEDGFRASFRRPALSGTPRSLTERLFLEEVQEERKRTTPPKEDPPQ